jgi:hypothetical protein
MRFAGAHPGTIRALAFVVLKVTRRQGFHRGPEIKRWDSSDGRATDRQRGLPEIAFPARSRALDIFDVSDLIITHSQPLMFHRLMSDPSNSKKWWSGPLQGVQNEHLWSAAKSSMVSGFGSRIDWTCCDSTLKRGQLGASAEFGSPSAANCVQYPIQVLDSSNCAAFRRSVLSRYKTSDE